MTEKHQLQNNFISCSHTNLELETRVKDLTAEKSQLQRVSNLESEEPGVREQCHFSEEELKKETSNRGQYT